MKPMTGKTVLITGGTGGIGKAAAIGLASMARVGITGRNQARAERAATLIEAESGNPEVDVFDADSSSQAEGGAWPARSSRLTPTRSAGQHRRRGLRTIPALAPSNLGSACSRWHSLEVSVTSSPNSQRPLQQGVALTGLGDRPLLVVTAIAEAEKGWLPLQERVLHLSTNSVQRLLPDVTPASLIEDESDAAVASQASLDAGESVRTGAPLAAS